MALETQVEKKGGAALVDRLLGILEVEGDRLEVENAKLTETNKHLTADIKAKENRSKELDSQVQLKADQNAAELSRLAGVLEKAKAVLEQEVGPLRAIVKELQGQIENSHREVARIADSKKQEILSQTREVQAELNAAKMALTDTNTALSAARNQVGQAIVVLQKAL